MSFVNKKTRVFKEAGDIEVQRKRSDGRMKTYQSATDARAWCDSREQRRQYILDLVRQGDGKGLSLGKYIPIEAIIDILLANKNADIKRLQQENEELRNFIKMHGLAYQEKEKPVGVTELGEDGHGPLGAAERDEDAAAGRSEARSGTAKVEDGSRISDRAGSKGADQGSGRGLDQGGPDQVGARGADAGSISTKDSRAKPLGASSIDAKGSALSKGSRRSEMESQREGPVSGAPIEFCGEETTSGDGTTPAFFTDSSDYEGDKDSPRYKRAVSPEDEKAAAEFLADKSPEEQIDALRQALSEREDLYQEQRDIAVAAIEKLENIKDIVEDTDDSKKPKRSSVKAPTSGVGRRYRKDSGTGSDSCRDEIEALEREIDAMRISSSPEQAIIQREVQVLKKYCAKLSAIQEENSELKKERDMLKDGADDAVKAKLQKLDQVTQERDKLRAKVQQLEEALGKPTGSSQQSEGIPPLKSDGLDELREECVDLRRRLDNTDGLEDAIRGLKGKVHQGGDSAEKDKLLTKIAALERELENLKCKLKEIDILKIERDCLRNRLEDLAKIQKDYEELLKKTQGYDALKADCAMYKAKYEELQKMECECNELRSKVQRLDELENERALLMKEIQDCECCMNNQEDEIKRLACHIECLSQDLDKRQDEMKVKVITMRAHLEKKDDIIAKSEQQLADVQDQLRNSIESLSCETSCLHNRIEELEDEVKEYESKVKEYGDKMMELQSNLETKEENNKALLEKVENEKNTSAKLEEALKQAIKNDVHLKQMLKQAKCVIKCITQKLSKYEIVDAAKMLAEKENYDRKIKELEEQVAVLEAAKLNLEVDKANLQADKANCEANKANLEAEIENYLTRIRKLEDELAKHIKIADAPVAQAFGEEDEEHMCGAEQIAELEEELMRTHATIKCLRNNLEDLEGLEEENEMLRKLNEKLQSLPEENEALRKLIKELQDAAKTQVVKLEDKNENLRRRSQDVEDKFNDLQLSQAEKDKLIEELRKELASLKLQLEREKKLREQAEALLAEMSNSGDADLAELHKHKSEINILSAENDRLNFELEKQKADCEELVKKLKAKIEQLSVAANAGPKEVAKLQEELEKLKAELADLHTDNDRLNKENELLRGEVERFRKAATSTGDAAGYEITKLNEELTVKDQQIKDLQDAINKLKQELAAKADVEKLNKELQDEITKLDQLIKQESTAKENAEKEIKNLKDQINKLLQESTAKEKTIKDLQDEINRLKKDCASKGDVARVNSDLQDDLSKLQQDLASRDKTIKDLQDEINRLIQDLALKAKVEKENKALKDEIDKLKKELAAKESVEKTNNELQDEINRLKKDCSSKGDVDKANKDLQDKISKLKEELASKDKANRDLQDELTKLKRELSSKTNVENENKDIKDDLNKLKQELASKANLDKENKGLKDEINKLKQDLASKDKANKDLQDEINKLKKELASKGSIDADEVKKLKEELAAKEKENKDLKDQINKLKQELDAKEKEGKDLKDQVKKLKQDLSTKGAPPKDDGTKDALAKERDELLKQIAAQKKEIADLLDKIKQPASTEDNATFKELQNKNTENEKLKSTIADLEKQIKDLQKSKSDLEKQLKDLQKTNSDLDKQMKDLQKAKSDFEKQVKDLQNAKSDLEKQMKDVQNSLSGDSQAVSKENEKLKATIANLEKQIQDLQKAKADLEKQVKDLQNGKSDLDKQIKDLQKEAQKGIPPDTDKAMKSLRDTLEGEEKRSKELEEKLKKCLENSENLKKQIAQLEAENGNLKQAGITDIPTVGDGDDKDRIRQLEAELAKQKEDCNKMIASLKEQYDRDIKNLQKQHEASIDKLQKSQQDSLNKLNSQHDAEISGFKNQLRDEEVKKLPEKKLPEKKPPAKKPKPPPKKQVVEESPKETEPEAPPVSTAEVVEKPPPEEEKEETPKEEIKEEEPPTEEKKPKKLSIKTFDDVCICGKLPMVIPIAPPRAPQQQERQMRSPQEPPCWECYQPPQERPQRPIMPSTMPPCMQHYGLQTVPSMPGYTTGMYPPMMQQQWQSEYTPTPQMPPIVDEKFNSIKKIVELENQLLMKQKHTKQKIDTLQNTVDKFKRELELEKQKNNDLVNRYTNQSKTVANMKVEIDLVKRENVQDKRKLQQLNLTLKDILESGANVIYSCSNKNISKSAVLQARCGNVPHFHTELSLVKTDDDRYKHNCVMKRSCPCTEKSSDSFEIDE